MPRKFISKQERKNSYMKRGQLYTKKKILIPTLTLVMMMFAMGIGPASPTEVLAATTNEYIEMTVEMPTLSISQHETNLVKASNTQATFSQYWYQDTQGNWHIKDGNGNMVTNAWLCDDAVTSNGQNVWYLIDSSGNLITSGLVRDQTGNYYSLETNHNGFYGMLRYQSGTYDGINLTLDGNHAGSFAAIQNPEAIQALQSKYGLTEVSINNSNCLYTSHFANSSKPNPNTPTPQTQPQNTQNNNVPDSTMSEEEYVNSLIPGWTGGVPSYDDIIEGGNSGAAGSWH